MKSAQEKGEESTKERKLLRARCDLASRVEGEQCYSSGSFKSGGSNCQDLNSVTQIHSESVWRQQYANCILSPLLHLNSMRGPPQDKRAFKTQLETDLVWKVECRVKKKRKGGKKFLSTSS